MDQAEGSKLDQLSSFMARRRWVASCAELLALGFPRSSIRSWLRSGRLVPLLHHVYGFGRDIDTPESAWRAALCVAGSGGVLTGQSACELWGLVRAERAIPARILVAANRRKATHFTGRSVALSRTRVDVVRRSFEQGELRRRNGLNVTSPARALIDFAVEATPVATKFAFLEACRLGYFRRGDVDYCFGRIEGRRGASKLRPLLGLWVPQLGRINSVLEGLFLLTWVARDERVPLVNQKVHGYEVDCFWPEQRLIVELDGGAFHSDPLARARDAAKDQALRDRGFRVARFDYEPVRKTPELVVGEVTGLLAPPPRGRSPESDR